MTRIFTEGFEDGKNHFWDGITSNASVASSNGMTGDYCYNQGGISVQRTLPATLTEFYFRQRFRTNSVNSVNPTQFDWRSTAGTTLGSIRLINGFTKIYIGSNAQTPVGLLALNVNQTYLMEVHVIIDGTNGLVQVKLEGNVDITFNGNTGTTPVGKIGVNGASVTTIFLDDLALNDTAGSEDNSWCGDRKVYGVLVNGAGSSTQFTPNSGANYAAVDERPYDSETSYVESGTTGHIDLYTLQNLDWSGKSIKRVWTSAVARDTVAVGGTIQLGIKPSGSSAVWSGNKSLLTTYSRVSGDEHTVNPATGVAWTESDLDALEIGIKAG